MVKTDMTGNAPRFAEELSFFIAHQPEFVEKYDGMALLIRGHELLGAFETPLDAYLAGQKRFPPGTFVVQPCAPGPDAYTVTLT